MLDLSGRAQALKGRPLRPDKRVADAGDGLASKRRTRKQAAHVGKRCAGDLGQRTNANRP